ncbi:MAG: translation initiation factor IF-6 [Candidatus Lokiarchaeota archaeon]|nr:translation initiation factor IF-6 [Candidatus Lokiarchaeota archaeon]
MGIIKETIFGYSSLGVYLTINNNFMLYPQGLSDTKIESYKTPFPKEFSLYPFSLNSSSLLGTYIVMNSRGIIVPEIILDSEMDALKDITDELGYNIGVMSCHDNAFGNLILTNDKGAVISTLLKSQVKEVRDVLDVEVLILDYANSKYPGSAGLTNNSGCCVHPIVKEEEVEMIGDVLKVDIDVSTINLGNPFIHAGAVVNDYGGIFGRDSSGPEMMRLTNVLKF